MTKNNQFAPRDPETLDPMGAQNHPLPPTSDDGVRRWSIHRDGTRSFMQTDDNGMWVKHSDCEVLAARLKEAEESAACWKQQVESHELFEEGRKQGLDEALAVTVPSTSWGTEGLPQKYAEAIEALKDQTND